MKNTTGARLWHQLIRLRPTFEGEGHGQPEDEKIFHGDYYEFQMQIDSSFAHAQRSGEDSSTTSDKSANNSVPTAPRHARPDGIPISAPAPAIQEAIVALFTLPDTVAKLERRIDQLEAENKRLRNPVPPKFYSLKQAAATLNCSQDTVRRWIKEGLLSRNGMSRHIMIPREDVENFHKKVAI